jgi:hypothetical protein
MSKRLDHEEIEKLLAEADELVRKVDSDVLKDLQEEHRLKVLKHANFLKKAKSEVQTRLEKGPTADYASSSEGIHQAIDDIVKAVKALAKYLT